MRNDKVYFDNAATTQMDPKVLEAMLPYFTEVYGNSHSLHSFGMEAEAAIEKSREQIAKSLNTKPDEIVFAGNGVDSDEVIIEALLNSNKSAGTHVLFSSIEHRGLMKKAKELEIRGYDVEFIRALETGVIDLDDLMSKVRRSTALVSVVHVNGDTGMVQPIEDVVKVVKSKSNALVHSDGVQAVVGLPVDLESLGVDAYNFSAHKIYGPKGISAIYTKNSMIESSKIEKGTQNTPLIVGMAASLSRWLEKRDTEVVRIKKVSEFLVENVLDRIPDSKLVGDLKIKAPQITTFVFKNVHRELLTLKLDDDGFAVSPGAACASRDVDASHILKAMGVEKSYINGSLRVSLGQYNTVGEAETFVKVLAGVVGEIRGRK